LRASDNDLSCIFVGNACQYYVAARLAMRAQCVPVTGTLFHHAVEMLLKGGLARNRSPSELKDMGHNLKKIWRAFKEDFPGPDLIQYDKAISGLDKFKDIRYPEEILRHGMSLSAEWWGPPGEVTAYGGIKTTRRYVLLVSEIDALVADVFKTCSWNPGVFMGSNPTALEAIRYRNDQAEFLTTVFGVPGAPIWPA
jgi:hypothetical protein